VFALRGADWAPAALAMFDARREWLLAAAALALAVEVVKAARWALLLGSGVRVFGGLLGILLTGRLLNAVAPVRAGDLWRVAAAARALDRSLVGSFAAVAAEKALDLVAVGSCGALFAVLLGAPLALSTDAAFSPRGIGAGLLGLLAVALVLLIGVGSGRSRLPLLARGARSLRAELRFLRRGALLGSAALTLVAVAAGLAVNLAVLAALGAPLSPVAALGMLVAGYAAGLAPSAPAALGVFEIAVAAPLLAIGFDPASAVAAALLLHLVLLATYCAGAGIALAVGGRRWSARRGIG
jgi:uncharacterized membrane protein YbhN (UPF0104 family)